MHTQSPRILFNQTAFLGDLLLSIPTLNNLKRIFPNGNITLICRKGTASLAQELKLADQIFEVDKKNSDSLKALKKNIKTQSYDIAISPHESTRSALFMWNVKAECKIGFYRWWSSWIYNKTIPRNMSLPDALRQLSLLSELDEVIKQAIVSYSQSKGNFGKLRVDSLSDRLKVPALAFMGLKNRIQSHRSIESEQSVICKYPQVKDAIFIAPGSVWETKKWTLDGYVELSKKLAHNNQIILIGSPDEKSLCDKIQNEVPSALNLAGRTTLFELLCLMTEGKALVCNDSGSMHLGSVAELPTVAIFGPTVLEIGYQPWQDKALVVENTRLNCRPCGLHGHKVCPIGTHECMKSISANEIISSLGILLR